MLIELPGERLEAVCGPHEIPRLSAWLEGACASPGVVPAPVIDAPVDNSYDRLGAFAVSGTAEAGSTVQLYEGTTEMGSVKAGGDGRFSIALSGVPEGRHTYTACQGDRIRDGRRPRTDPSRNVGDPREVRRCHFAREARLA